MVKIEAFFIGVAISEKTGNVLSGDTLLSAVNSAVFKTEDGDVFSVEINHWTCYNQLELVPNKRYQLGLNFITTGSKFMGVCALTLRAKANEVLPIE